MSVLTPESEARFLDLLRDEALDACQAIGCTCEPRLHLTDTGFGALDISAWMSDHDDDCALAELVTERSE